MARFKVLAVDDDPRIAKLIKVNMETLDAKVAVATSGNDCLRILREEKQDLVLLDLNLKDSSGWDVLAMIRNNELTRSIPVVIVSVESPDQNEIGRLRPDGYLQKPFDARKMVDLAKAVLEGRARRVRNHPAIIAHIPLDFQSSRAERREAQ